MLTNFKYDLNLKHLIWCELWHCHNLKYINFVCIYFFVRSNLINAEYINKRTVIVLALNKTYISIGDFARISTQQPNFVLFSDN